jgi:hypothetical protein
MTKTKVARKESNEVRLSLALGELVFKAQAKTFQEALEKIHQDSFGKVKTWGIIALQVGKKKAELQLRPIQIKRAFTMKFANDLLEKRLLMILK